MSEPREEVRPLKLPSIMKPEVSIGMGDAPHGICWFCSAGVRQHLHGCALV